MAAAVRYVARFVVMECCLDIPSADGSSEVGEIGAETLGVEIAGEVLSPLTLRVLLLPPPIFVASERAAPAVPSCWLVAAVRFLCPLGDNVREIVCKNLLRLVTAAIGG